MAVENTTGEVGDTPNEMEDWTSDTKQGLQLPRIITKGSREESPKIVLARRILSCKLSDRVYGAVSTTEPFRQRLRKDLDELVRAPTSLAAIGHRSPQCLGELTPDVRGLGERQKTHIHPHGNRIDHKHEKHERDTRKGDDSGLGSSVDQKRVQCHFIYKKSKFYERRKPLSVTLPKDSVNVDNVRENMALTRSKYEEPTKKEPNAKAHHSAVLPVNPDILNRRRNTKEVLGTLCDHPAITRKILRELDEKGIPPKERTYEWLMKYTV